MMILNAILWVYATGLSLFGIVRHQQLSADIDFYRFEAWHYIWKRARRV